MLAYCDYISSLIHTTFLHDSTSSQGLLSSTNGVKWDLHPEEGYMLSTTKTIECVDVNGKKYRVTVEEIDG